MTTDLPLPMVSYCALSSQVVCKKIIPAETAALCTQLFARVRMRVQRSSAKMQHSRAWRHTAMHWLL